MLLYGEWTFQTTPQLGMFCSGRRDAVADGSASWRAEAPRRPRAHKRRGRWPLAQVTADHTLDTSVQSFTTLEVALYDQNIV